MNRYAERRMGLRSVIVAASLCVATSSLAAIVVEFYNTTLDNYFITADPIEAAAVDAGAAGPGWARTGFTFPTGGLTPVCRFYGSITPGPNSHFYTIDPNECEQLKQVAAATPASEKRWNFESLDFKSTGPVGNACPSGITIPVYRAYNNGFARGVDSNHRITSHATGIQQVVAKGWTNEGIVMCALAPVAAANAMLDCYRPFQTLTTEYVVFGFNATNNTGFAIGRLYMHVRLLIPAAAIPLIAEGDYFYEIAGGLANGASLRLDLQPNQFSDFAVKAKPFCHDSRRVFEVTITGVTDGSGARHNFVD